MAWGTKLSQASPEKGNGREKRITNSPARRQILSHNQFFRKSTGFRNTQLYWKWMFCVHENRFSISFDSTDAVMSKSLFTWNDACRVCWRSKNEKLFLSHVKMCRKVNACYADGNMETPEEIVLGKCLQTSFYFKLLRAENFVKIETFLSIENLGNIQN